MPPLPTATPDGQTPVGPRAGSRPGRAPTRSAAPPVSPYRANSTSSPSQTRSESQPGSKVPLLRGRRLDSAPPLLPPTSQQQQQQQQRDFPATPKDNLRDPEKADHQGAGPQVTGRRERSHFFPRLARHFIGVRGERALPTPLVRPLRHLSPDLETYLLTFLGSFPSILIACAISYGLSRLASSTPAFAETPLTVGSFGATAVLLYATPEAPLSQPRNVILGHTLSALVGAVVSQLFALDDRFTKPLADGNDNTLAAGTSWPSLVPLSGAFAVGLATLGMQLTGTVHPPGGATALIAAYHRTTGPRYTYILDVFLSVTAMTVWAFFVNNLGRRRYPTHWWVPKKPVPAPGPPTAPSAAGGASSSASSSSQGSTAAAAAATAAAAAATAPSAGHLKVAPSLHLGTPHSPSASSASRAPPLPLPLLSRSRSRSRSGVSPRLDPAADLDLDPVALAADEARSLRNRNRNRYRSGASPRRSSQGRVPSDGKEQEEEEEEEQGEEEEEEEEEVFTPLEDAERRWLGRLGEEDEEALGPRDERARREAFEWEERRRRSRSRSRERRWQ